MCFCVVLIELVVDLGGSVSVFLCSSHRTCCGSGAFVCRGGVEIAIFAIFRDKSGNRRFSAKNREIGVFPRRTAKSTIFRDKSRYNLFSATDREISCLCKLKFRSLDLFQRNLTKRYKI